MFEGIKGNKDLSKSNDKSTLSGALFTHPNRPPSNYSPYSFQVPQRSNTTGSKKKSGAIPLRGSFKEDVNRDYRRKSEAPKGGFFEMGKSIFSKFTSGVVQLFSNKQETVPSTIFPTSYYIED